MTPDAAACRLLGTGLAAAPSRLGGGHVNETYLVETAHGLVVLQRINPAVFPAPQLVIDNLLQFRSLLVASDALTSRCWCFPEPLPAVDGSFSLADSDGALWRLLRHIAGRSQEVIEHPAQAASLGQCLADLHLVLCGADSAFFADTLPEFHRLDAYLAAYDRVTVHSGVEGTAETLWCRERLAAGRQKALALFASGEAGQLCRQVVHGDPKVANYLFAPDDSGEVLALIDFDTLKPGLLLHDVGDCLRSLANPAGESSSVPCLRSDLCHSMLDSYLAVAGHLLTPADRLWLPDAPWYMSYELGLRFFSDHLAGDRYFRVESHGDNLRRARSQLLLADLFASARAELAAGL
ncbi:MAG: hypothetical protein BWK76_06090 [Desulfobulbaceae bacterium A2]|nr:MAG: hypothetical protein BWK76_06090 [Desulfobulbaceae bacterium A2]